MNGFPRWSCMRPRVVVGIALFMNAFGSANAYEITTHALITQVAQQRSVLNSANANAITPIVGFDRLAIDAPFRADGLPSTSIKDAYYDDEGTSQPNLPPLLAAHTRFLQQQERSTFASLIRREYIPGDPLVSEFETRLVGWLMRGAVREDDNDVQPFGIWTDGDDRDLDPYGRILRAAKHFYDPARNRGYDFPSQCATYGCAKSILWATGRTDPLNPGSDADDLTRRNHFTWQDARNNYWWALTLERGSSSPRTATERCNDSQDRHWRWSTAIKSLGHTLHLLQDAAQPQHTRNDAHAPPHVRYSSDGLPNEGEADAAYEAYTDYRVTADYAEASGSGGLLGNPLRYMDESVPAPSQVIPVTLGNYPNIAFSTPVKYFTTRHVDTAPASCGPGSPTVNVVCARRGMADYSNRGFFTSGTVPGMRECVNPGPGANPCSTYATGSTYPMPEEAFNANDWESFALPSEFYVNGKIVKYTEFARTVPDNIAPSHDAALLAKYHGKVPILTQGIFKNVLDLLPPEEREGVDQTMRYNNMQYDADVLIPRAIGYSAGMIDFFFRGRIKVEAPQDGVLSVTDQGMAHTVDPATAYPYCTNTVAAPIAGEPPLCTAGDIFGFTKLRLKVRNDTPALTESGSTAAAIAQDMATTLAAPGPTDPRLVAVARYHRNRCYDAGLQGESVVDYAGTVTTPTCAGSNRSTYQEISVSKPLAVGAATLNGASSAPVTFDFGTDPIPINATDLIIQVVYRGPLGEEIDGIAVGSFDIREASYLTLWNNTDYAGCNGNWVTSSGGGCSFPGGIARGIGTARLCINAQLLYTRQPTGGNGNILKGHYVRLAALLDDQPKNTRGRLLVGTANDLVIVDKSLTGQVRQASMEIVTPTAPYLPEPFYTKRGVIGSFRPMPFYLISGADPQPPGDMGPNDVGSLSLPLNAPAHADTGGVISFPNTPPAPNSACTSTSAAPYFEDEIEVARPVGTDFPASEIAD